MKLLITYEITFNPFTPTNKLLLGTITSSITICPVTEALNENFPSILGAVKPLIPCDGIHSNCHNEITNTLPFPIQSL